MDALAEKWFCSGKIPDNLYRGKTEEIIKELKTCVKARGARHVATMDLLWDIFETNDTLLGIRIGHAAIQDALLAPFKAKYVKNVERAKVRMLPFMRHAFILC